MKKEMIIVVGCSGSGKTSWANKHVLDNENWEIICRDEQRSKLFTSNKHSKTRENRVTEECFVKFQECVKNNANIIIADTNLSPKYRKAWELRGKHTGYEVVIKEFPVESYDELLKINKGKSLKENTLKKQWDLWMKYKEMKTYIPDTTKPKALIVDIDGTIAIRGDRSPYDLSRIGEDIPRKTIIQMIQQFATLHRAVLIFMSGRDGVCYQDTRKWLCDHTYFTGSLGDMLIMRDEGDNRKDAVIKEELFWKYISDSYNVLAVFDDRPQVVEMWHDIGIENIICVADQRNRF